MESNKQKQVASTSTTDLDLTMRNIEKRGASPSPVQPKKMKEETVGFKYQIRSCSVKGNRTTQNEDRVDIKTSGPFQLFGVFDGHGGPQASEYCRQNLLADLDKSLYSGSNVEEVISSIFKTTHVFMFSKHKNWPRQGNMSSIAGTTASVVAIYGRQVYVANVGDSPVLRICRKEDGSLGAVEMTTMHKPGSDDDGHVKENGGRIVGGHVQFLGEDNGNQTTALSLSMTRALGDFYSLNSKTGVFAIQHAPSIASFKLDPKMDQYIILASDGITDKLSHQEIVDVLEKARKNTNAILDGTENAARDLCEMARAKWGKDDIDDCSAIVLYFKF